MYRFPNLLAGGYYSTAFFANDSTAPTFAPASASNHAAPADKLHYWK
jgi:hypothetical protein